MKKICTYCKISKPIEDFWVQKNSKDGRKCWCKKCQYAYTRRYRFTPKNKMTIMYNGIQWRNQKHIANKRKGFKPINFSLAQFQKFLLEKTNFIELHNAWIKTGMKMNDSPTIDRIDSTKSYYLKNMQCVTFRENNAKPKPRIIKS